MDSSIDRQLFLERLSVLSFALVAGCAGGASRMLPDSQEQSLDREAAARGVVRTTDAATGSTTITIGSGHITTTPNGSSLGVTYTDASGNTSNVMSIGVAAASGLVTWESAQNAFAAYSFNVNSPPTGVFEVASHTLTPTSSTQVSIAGPTVNGPTSIVNSTTTTITATNWGTTESGAHDFSGPTGGGCTHACPLVGTAAAASSLPRWVGPAIAGIGVVLAVIGLCLAIVEFTVVALLFAAIMFVFAVISFIISLL